MYLKQIKKVTFIGTETAGCQGTLCFVDLPFDGFAGFSGMRVRDLDGCLAGAIKPDIEVATEESLARALVFLKQYLS